MPPRKFRFPNLSDVIAELMDAQGDKWMRFVVRVLGNQDDAEDVIQEAVRRVLLRNLPFQNEEEVRMYLGRAIANTAIETYHSRRRERLRRLPLREHLLPSPDSPDPHAALEHRELSAETSRLIALLEEGLARLPVKQYEAVRMALLEPGATSIREAGSVKGIPYSTLRHRYVRGLRSLKKYIKRALRSRAVKLLVA